MGIECWITGHKWRLISEESYMDASYGKDQALPSHTLTFICVKCCKTKEVSNFGGGRLIESQIKDIIEKEKNAKAKT